MARYQVPPDPRDPESSVASKRPRHQRSDSQEPVPWLWLGLGVVVTVIGVWLAYTIASSLLFRPPLDTIPLQPTLIVLTAPPSLTPSVTPLVSTPTAIPTLTPIPTPDTAVAPPEVTVGYYATVADTGGPGLTLRGGPSTNNVALTVIADGTLLLVIGGPAEGSDRLWWQVRLEDETEGWVAAEFLQPAAGP